MLRQLGKDDRTLFSCMAAQVRPDKVTIGRALGLKWWISRFVRMLTALIAPGLPLLDLGATALVAQVITGRGPRGERLLGDISLHAGIGTGDILDPEKYW